ncbi:hypothetical protein MCEMKE14_00276 [Candidatus Nanopelagicaceae bacterium]
MQSKRISTSKKLALIIATSSLLLGGVSTANAANKTITCYKGKIVKKVTAKAPKCPKGYTTKKPVVTSKPSTSATPKPTATATATASTPAVTSNKFAFNGTYKGKMSIVWSDADVRATSVSGDGTGSIFGMDSLSGSGESSPSTQCAGLDGVGVISGGGSSIKVSFDTSAKVCAEDGAAPTTINITGFAVVNSGTGKFAGASGKLKAVGFFNIKSADAGASETSVLTLTLTGEITTK